MTEATTHVEIDVPETTATEEPTSEPTTVVVADTGSDGIHPAIAEFMSEVRTELANLRRDTEDTASTAASAAITAEEASQAVDTAVADVEIIAGDVSAQIEETHTQPEPETDARPQNEHAWFKSRGHNT